MKELWAPESVAVVGARPGSLGERVLTYLRQHGYSGTIHEQVPSEPVDLALLMVGARRVLGALRECAASGVRYAMVCASGFSESGDGALEAEVTAFARAHGIRLVGPNCIGLVSPPHRLVAGFSPLFSKVTFAPGNLALVAQSGALGYGIASLAVERGLGFSRIINTGNEADMDAAEVAEYLLEDEQTDVILVYGEGLKRPLAWRELAVKARKPIIILKAGRSEAGGRAAASHTAAMAGDDAVWETAFRQLGFHRVDDVDEMLDLAAAFAQPRRSAGRRAAVLTTSGGAGILAADALTKHGLQVPQLEGPARAALEQLIPRFGSSANPVDVTAQVISDSKLFREALGVLARDPALDFLLVCFCVLQGEEAERIAGDLLAVHTETGKPMLVSRTGADFLAPGLAARLQRAGIPVFATPGRAAAAAAALTRRPPAPLASFTPHTGGGPGVLLEHEVKVLLKAEGLPVTQEALAASADEAVGHAKRLGYPVVLKVVSPDILHKTEVGGVRLNLRTPDEVQDAFHALATKGEVLVQEQVRNVVAEVLVGVSPTPIGPMLTAGLGGIFTEVLQDVSRRLVPVGREEATAMLRELRGYPLLAGARGRPAGDLDALADLISRLSQWATTYPGQWELDLNPVMLTPEGCTIADALLIERGPGDA